MRKQLLIPLLLLCFSAVSYGQVNSNLLGQPTISSGSFSNEKLNVRTAPIIQLAPNKTTGVKSENNYQPKISLFPNPATDVVHIQNDDSKIKGFSVQLIDIQGKVVMETLNVSEKITKLNIANLPAGSYMVNLINSDKNIIKNFKFTKTQN